MHENLVEDIASATIHIYNKQSKLRILFDLEPPNGWKTAPEGNKVFCLPLKIKDTDPKKA